MAKYIDLTDENDFEDYKKVSSLIGKDYSNVENRTALNRRSQYGNNSIVRGTEYKMATASLNNLAIEVTKISKRILNVTANTVTRAMSSINQDLGVSGSKLGGMSLTKISPLLGYVIAKMLDSGAFQGVYTRLQKGMNNLFKSLFSWAGIDTSSVKSFIKGVITFPFRVLGRSLLFVAKLPFKAISSTITAVAKTMIFLTKLPWKIIYGGMSAIFKVASIPFNIAMWLAKIPFKALGGILGAVGLRNTHVTGGSTNSNSGTEIRLQDRQFKEVTKPFNDINKTLKRIFIVIAGLTVGLLGVKGLMSGSLKAAIATSGVGMMAAGGFLLSQWAKTKSIRDKSKTAAEGYAEKAKSAFEEMKETPMGAMFSGFFKDEGEISKIRNKISESTDNMSKIFKETYDKVKGGANDFIFNPFSSLPKDEIKGKFNKLTDALEKAFSSIERGVTGTVGGVYSESAANAGAMGEGRFNQAKWLGKVGLGVGTKGAWRGGKRMIGTSWDLATSLLKIPSKGVSGALEEFAGRTESRNTREEEKSRMRVESTNKWNRRFAPIDNFFKGWEKGASDLPIMGKLLSWGIKAPFKATAGIGKSITKILVDPIENGFRKVMTDPKVTEKFGKGFFKSFISLAVPLFAYLFKGSFAPLKMLLGGGGKLLGGLGKGGLKMGGAALTISQLAQLAWNPTAYAKSMTGKEKLKTGDTLIAGIGGIISGGSKEGGPWGMLRGMAAGTALGGFPWGTAIGGVAGLVGVQNMVKTKDALTEVGSSLGTGLYDAIHAKTGIYGGMKAFFSTLSSTGSVTTAMSAYAAAYTGNLKESTGSISSKIPNNYTANRPSLSAAFNVAKMESGGDPGKVHWDVNDWSYGAFQIHGTNKAKQYVDRYLSDTKISKMPIKTKSDVVAFNKEFSDMATRSKTMRDRMFNTQNEFMGETQYRPMIKAMGDLGMVLDAKTDPRLQIMLQSTSNQLGDLAPHVIKHALGSRKDIENLSPQQIVDKIAAYKIKNVDTLFKTAISTKQYSRASLENRIREEAGWSTGSSPMATGVPGNLPATTAKMVATQQASLATSTANAAAEAITRKSGEMEESNKKPPIAIINNNSTVSNSAKTSMPSALPADSIQGGSVRRSLDNIILGEIVTAH